MAKPVIVSYSIRDDRGKLEPFVYHLPNGTTVAQVNTETTTFAPLLDVVTGGVIAAAYATFPLTLPGGLKATAVADSLREWGALLGFSQANSNLRWTTRVPAIDPAYVVNGEIVDVTDDIAALTAKILTGTAVNGTDENGDDLLAHISTKFSSHTRRR